MFAHSRHALDSLYCPLSSCDDDDVDDDDDNDGDNEDDNDEDANEILQIQGQGGQGRRCLVSSEYDRFAQFYIDHGHHHHHHHMMMMIVSSEYDKIITPGKDGGEWLQIDLGAMHVITATETMGRYC